MSTPYRYEGKPGELAAQERSLGDLLSDLSSETGTLIRKELELASTELTHKATFAGRQLAFIAVGSLLATLGVLLLLQALVIGLSAYMPAWVASLIVGLVVAGIAGALASKGIATLQHAELKPQRTIQSIEANKSLVRGQAK